MRSCCRKYFYWIVLAVGLLFADCSREKGQLEEDKLPVASFLDELSPDSLQHTVLWLQNKKTRFFLNSNHREIAYDIKSRFTKLGYSQTRVDSFFLSAAWEGKTYNTWQYNVVARLEGRSSPEKVCLIGAHYDSNCQNADPMVSAPGADDNGSGVAGMLEIARVFKKRGFVPAKSIEFVAFAAEEYNLNGSNDYATRLAAKKVNIVMMLNLDMISFEPNSNPANWSLNVLNYDNSTDLLSRVVGIGKSYTGFTILNDNTNNKRSDSYSFYRQGYKSVFFISDRNLDPYYHTTGDVVTNCNFLYCRQVTALSCALLMQESN